VELLRRAPNVLVRLTLGYLAVWLVALFLWRGGDWLPAWLEAIVFTLSLPLGVAWIVWIRQNATSGAPHMTWALLGTAIYPFWWQLAVFWADVLGMPEARASIATTGLGGLFLIGLAWVIWALERASRRIERARLEAVLAQGPILVSPHEAAEIKPKSRGWNPFDPQAWYYGRGSQKLKQSTLAMLTYACLFWLAVMLATQIGGCGEIYEMPAGGGQQKTVAQTVRIQKVIRKKYIVNPFSAIKFEVPPIDEIKLQLLEVTAHQYVIGYGEGAGAGFAGGTSKGKVRLIRLEYDGGDWDLNHGPGGDENMLFEYGMLTQQKVSEKAESRRISQLAGFPAEKSPPVVFLTGQKSLSVSNNEAKILREYLIDKHGMIFASSGSAHFHNQFIATMNRVLPDVRPVPIPLDDTIHRVPFAVPFLPYVVPHGGKEALGWSMDGRWLVYYHPGDISDAWSDGHAGVSPDIYNSCYQLGANVINYGHMEYAKWLQTKGKAK
jgi:hypothetical protein